MVVVGQGVVGQGEGGGDRKHVSSSGMVYTLQTHVEFTFNYQMIPHTCIFVMVLNNE